MNEEEREELKEELKREMLEEMEDDEEEYGRKELEEVISGKHEEKDEVKEQKKKKNNNTWLIVLLVIIVIGLVGYIVYDKVIVGKIITEKSGEVTSNEIPDSNKASEEQVKELLNTYFFLNNDHYLFQQRLFEKGYDNYNKMYATWKGFSNDDFSSVTCSKLYSKSLYNEELNWYVTDNGVCSDELNPKSISYNKFNEKFKSLFAEDAKKEGLGNDGSWFFLDYKSNKYIELSCGGCGGTTGPHITINSLKDYNENDDELVVNVYYQFISSSGEYGTSGDQYSFPITGITINGTENYVYNQVTTRYMDLINSYQITFSKNDGNYIYKSMKKN